jgi:hypothetical protein
MTALTDPVSPPARTRRGVLIAAVLIVLFVIGNGAVQLTFQVLQTHFSQNSTIVPLAQQITVKGYEGSVVLVPSPDSRVHVQASGTYGAAHPDLVEDSTETGVVLEARCRDVTFVTCKVDYAIQVPPAFAVKVQGGSTDVLVRNLSGAIDIDLVAGSAEVSGSTGPLQMHSGSGTLSGDQIRSSVITATTVAGGVNLDLVVAPQSLTVDTGVGDVSIMVPGAYTYRVSADTADGHKQVGVAQDVNSTRAITATSESGDVRIRPRGQMEFRSPPLPPDPPDPPAGPR